MTEFGCQGINSSEDIVDESYFDYVSPCCTLNLKTAKNFFPRDTLAHDAASPYQVWRQHILWLRRYLDKYSLIYWTFTVTLTLNEEIHFFPQDTPAYDAVLSNQVWLQRNQHFRRYSRNSHILIISELAVTLTLKTVNQFFCVTLWLMMLYKYTKFGNKMFCSSEDIPD